MTSRFEAPVDDCKQRVAVFALLVGLIIPVRASGQPGELVQLRWEAPDDCPTAATVLARVRALAGAASPSSLPLRAAVRVKQRSDGRFQLQLVVEKDGLVGERALEAGSCDDLVGAVAVNLALLLEDSPPLAATGTTDGSVRTVPPQGVSSATPKSAPPVIPNSARPHVIRALLQGPLLSLMFEPAPSIGASLGGGVMLESWRIAAGGSLWLQQTAESERPETGAKLARFTARVHVCRGFRVGPLELAPCLGMSLEHLRAQGYGPYVRGASAATTWLAAGTGVQARFPITPWLNVLGCVDLKLRAARPRVSIEGVGRISELGWVAAELSLGSEWIL